jgi:hypothetical protein
MNFEALPIMPFGSAEGVVLSAAHHRTGNEMQHFGPFRDWQT